MKAANGATFDWLARVALHLETDDCIIYPFGGGSHGYGETTTVGGTKALAHRAVCEMAHGAAPSDIHEAAHSCGTKRCVNKRHLRWATPKENQADKLIHGTLLQGERHPNAILSAQDVCTIRRARGLHREIATRFGVARQTITKIKNRRLWASISEADTCTS